MCVVRSVFGHLSGETGVSGSYDFDPPPNTLSELPLGERGGIDFTTTTSRSHLGARRDRNDSSCDARRHLNDCDDCNDFKL